MSSQLRYRGGDVRAISCLTVPMSGGIQLCPIEIGDLLIYCTVIASDATYYNCVVPAYAVFTTGTGTDRTLTSITAQGGSAISSANAHIITTAAGLYTAFAGVALHKTGLMPNETTARLSSNIDPGYTLVATGGRFEFDCASTTWKPGDLVAGYVSSSKVYNQQVASGGIASTTAIGVALPPYNQLGQAATSIIVEIRPTMTHAELFSGA